MTKVIRFNQDHPKGLYWVSNQYAEWIINNPQVKVVSVVYDDGTLLVTYED